MNVEIPEKLYFKIGEVAELTGIKPHVLRYWESEFGGFRPGKSRHNQRLYRRRDIELVLRIKDLLYDQGFTIAGAKKQLRVGREEKEQMALPLESEQDRQQLLEEIRADLRQLKTLLGAARYGTTS